MDKSKKIRIFNIQKYSLNDGSGIRTVVFLKGCPLRCRWCANPESQNPGREVIFRRSRCIGWDKCGLCKNVSPDIISFDEEGLATVDFSKCVNSPDWVGCCPAKALEVEGKDISIEEIIETVERDALFYRYGDGGMTVSGGEPLMQENVVDLLAAARESRINTAIETCGYAPGARLLAAAEYLNTVFFDIKSLNDKKHEEYTGVSGWRIRDNFESLYKAYPTKNIIVRTPVIPTFNDSEEELSKIEEYINSFPGVRWERLPYHTFGVGKYEMLGRKYLM